MGDVGMLWEAKIMSDGARWKCTVTERGGGDIIAAADINNIFPCTLISSQGVDTSISVSVPFAKH